MSFNEMTYGFTQNKPNCMIFSNENIEGYINEKNINDEIFILKSSIKAKSELTLNSSTNINGIILGYNLSGYSEHKSKRQNFSVKLSSNDSNMSIMKNENSTSYCSKGILNKISFVIKEQYIQRNITDNKIKDLVLSSLENDHCEKLIFKRKTNEAIKLILNDIFNLPFDESLNNIYLQSKALEIIFYELNSLSKEIKNFQNTIKLDEYDIQAIKKSKEILIQNIKNPPSIIELSKMVRINDFKLKIGFKEIFGETPYNLLINYKLDLAKNLLQQGDMNINEIATYIGYKYTQSFSSAFSKRYGVSPKDILKRKKYYY